MPTFITFDKTITGNSVIMKSNDAIASPFVDFREVVIQISNVETIILEENNDDGININLTSGKKYTIKASEVTRVGTNNKSPFTYTSSEELKDDLIALAGL